ncbi:MAG: UDP-N-acetylmuramate:L-alanyl-gamma-D-glutamyl-meso-diaminopimelate ligase [bacterium]
MRIHMLGIGGTGMGSLAGLFSEAGHTVTGTDQQLYPPMSDQIASLGIAPFEGYRAENIEAARPDLVVIGNVIRRDNPEAEEAIRRKLPYLSMPQALAEHFLAGRTPLVIAGTHGKTTCATLAAWLLTEADEKPGFLIGGVGKNLGRSYEVGSGQFFVVEGDEYDTAFFDKGPKFLHYRPQAAIITSIEFDHADIYRDVDHITSSFERLAKILPPDGLLVINAACERAMRVAKEAPCRTVSYGTDAKALYRPLDVEVTEAGTSFELGTARTRFRIPMWGEHNLENAAGVLALLIESGVDPAMLTRGIENFEGVKRRQELLGEADGVAVIDDFAHHPTAVAKTIDAIRLRFPRRRIWAIFEPRSNTSRRNVFQHEFARSLARADRVIVASPYLAEKIPDEERLDSAAVAAEVNEAGTGAVHIELVDDIVAHLMKHALKGDVLLIMSNGGFGGLHGRLLEALAKR